MAGFVDHPQYVKIDAYVQSVLTSITNSQNKFFSVNGRYFQGLWLLGDVQVDGTKDETILNTTSPSDFSVDWKTFDPVVFMDNSKIPVNIRVDVYKSIKGWGWNFFAECYYAGLDPDKYGNYGDKWVYKHHHGPDIPDYGVWDNWHIEVEE